MGSACDSNTPFRTWYLLLFSRPRSHSYTTGSFISCCEIQTKSFVETWYVFQPSYSRDIPRDAASFVRMVTKHRCMSLREWRPSCITITSNIHKFSRRRQMAGIRRVTKYFKILKNYAAYDICCGCVAELGCKASAGSMHVPAHGD